MAIVDVPVRHIEHCDFGRVHRVPGRDAQSPASAQSKPKLAKRKKDMSNETKKDHDMAQLSQNVLKAHNFEKSKRARPSVFTDPFYTVPTNTEDAPPGTLLKLETNTDTSLYTLPPNISLSRLMYKSQTSSGSLVPVSACILWPYVARSYPTITGYPVVAWAHGTSGSTAECAPSNIKDLWHHFQAPYQLALDGYVVIATDYAGLGVGADEHGKPIAHEYLTGPAQANDVAFSVQAARAAFPELSEEFVVIGSSLGGGGAWALAQRMATEPMIGYLGTVALSPVMRLLSLAQDTAVFPMLILLLVPSLVANFPDFEAEALLTPTGMQCLETYHTLQGCNNVLFQTASVPNMLQPGWQHNIHLHQYQEIAANGRRETRGPLLVIQGAEDPIVSAQSVTDGITETVKKFPTSQIEYHLLPHVTHASAMYAGQHIYMEWIAARFKREPAPPGYRSHVAEPIRPGVVQQAEANWFIQAQTEPWQAV